MGEKAAGRAAAKAVTAADILAEMRSHINEAAGPHRPGETRRQWLARAASQLGVSADRIEAMCREGGTRVWAEEADTIRLAMARLRHDQQPGRVEVPLARMPGAEDLDLPAYASALAAGMDLQAAVAGETVLAPLDRALVPTGLRIALPPGYEAQIRPRSGLALRHGLTVLNSPGTIDADFRGEVCVILINLGREPVTVTRGMRIAQLVVAPHATVVWQDRPDLDPSPRGAGGFGSTGTG